MIKASEIFNQEEKEFILWVLNEFGGIIVDMYDLESKQETVSTVKIQRF